MPLSAQHQQLWRETGRVPTSGPLIEWDRKLQRGQEACSMTGEKTGTEGKGEAAGMREGERE